MRYDRRYTRTLNMITAPEIPRLENSGVALCHLCQRSVYFAGGFLDLLLKALEREIHYGLRMKVHNRGD